MASSDVGSPTRVVGRYTLQREIASGGMASVYLGKMRGPLGFTPLVAIKSLHPQFAKDPDFVRMFLDEARLAARIRHPNIVPVIDVHAEDDVLFLVLEYIHGESLSRLVNASRKAGTPPSIGVAAAILGDVLQGLHAAHEAKSERGEPLGIVHRDVSPQNVLVGADGVARVLDFGIAKAAGRLTTTSDGQVKGKFAYMPPEQLRGEIVDRRADVYSASVVLWELLTASRLFRAESEGHTVERVLFGAVEPPSRLRPEIPAALDAVVMRGLSRERADRFASAKEMAMALGAAVLSASPPEVGEWVEARAIDALEQRAKLVEEIEQSVHDATAAARAVEPVDVVVTPLPSPRRRLTAVLFAVAVLVAVVGVSLGIVWARPEPPGATASAPSASASGATPSLPPVLPDQSPEAASAASPSPAAPDTATAAARPAAVTDPRTARSSPAPRTATSTPRATKPAAPSSKTACTRRSANGEIEFDTACLRAQGP